ncbi:MAG: hypothetical protein OXI08_08630 [Cyanobacteria bacterium MAG IRC4_bin_6]|nr:hypothetical protein [Cyanobacteria bacterium MAG IRC3_bin_20]MDE0648077.1 hypothetical protein [Cyanobacteria bacterium MAG IRC4_bin_6]MXY19063.1 hypothetical protein [Synechococcus sp. SB0664_bin_36]
MARPQAQVRPSSGISAITTLATAQVKFSARPVGACLPWYGLPMVKPPHLTPEGSHFEHPP